VTFVQTSAVSIDASSWLRLFEPCHRYDRFAPKTEQTAQRLVGLDNAADRKMGGRTGLGQRRRRCQASWRYSHREGLHLGFQALTQE
jgi:hypothetical protein